MTWYEDLFNRQTFLDLYAEQDSRLAVQEVDGLVSLLNLQPGQSILDVCCGYGRHAIELAKRGHRVTGVDLSPLQVNAAVAEAAKEGVQAEFLVGDARHMRFQQRFDVALNMLTSFGLFEEDADHLEMLGRIADATKLGGLFLMDLWNREQVIRDFGEREIETRPDGIKIEEQWPLTRGEAELTGTTPSGFQMVAARPGINRSGLTRWSNSRTCWGMPASKWNECMAIFRAGHTPWIRPT